MIRWCIFVENTPMEWTLRSRRNDCFAAVENKWDTAWSKLRKEGYTCRKVRVSITPV